MSAAREIERLVSFAADNGIIEEADRTWARNALLGLLNVAEPYGGAAGQGGAAAGILNALLDDCAERGVVPDDTVTNRDLMDARIMGAIMARPSEVCRRFFALYKNAPEAATDWFYKLNRDVNYIQTERIAKNLRWTAATAFGDMEITINLSKPEKTGAEIARALAAPASGYPKCLLCAENEGFFGDGGRPARENLRLIPLKLHGERWFFQYSPYVYYNEHCIVLKDEHAPMNVDGRTIRRLFDFVDMFPHYFLGSNAGLPIVGGSILNHDHYQGGRYAFPMEKAGVYRQLRHPAVPGAAVGLVKWPMPVLRVAARDRRDAERLADIITETWLDYTDEALGIIARTDAPHNAVTPIARINGDGLYELDIVPRNNRVTAEYPMGVFHPHAGLHHIKQENIGLIEVMGLAVLPGRLAAETAAISAMLAGRREVKAEGDLEKHGAWIGKLISRHGTGNSAEAAERIVRMDIGRIFAEVLADAGVFKFTEEGKAGLLRFVGKCGLESV